MHPVSFLADWTNWAKRKRKRKRKKQSANRLQFWFIRSRAVIRVVAVRRSALISENSVWRQHFRPSLCVSLRVSNSTGLAQDRFVRGDWLRARLPDWSISATNRLTHLPANEPLTFFVRLLLILLRALNHQCVSPLNNKCHDFSEFMTRSPALAKTTTT